MKILTVTVLAAALAGCGLESEKWNDKPRFADSGLPTNCRALIQANLDGYISGAYTPAEALGSIGRNCSANGPPWP